MKNLATVAKEEMTHVFPKKRTILTTSLCSLVRSHCGVEEEKEEEEEEEKEE